MRFFQSIREIMATVAQSMAMLASIAGLMLYFFILFAVAGKQLFAGVLSTVCLAPGYVHGLEPAECPSKVPCIHQCYRVSLLPNATHVYMSQDRLDHQDSLGFDSLTTAFATEFGVMILDSWTLFSHPIRTSPASTRGFAFPLFASMVLVISLVTVNLFLAAITFTFLKIRRGERHEQLLADFAENFDGGSSDQTNQHAGMLLDDDHVAPWHFPMNPWLTPKFASIERTRWFERACTYVVVLNTIVMASAHHNMATWLVVLSTFFEVIFTLCYTAEAGIKIFAIGLRPCWRSKMNRRVAIRKLKSCCLPAPPLFCDSLAHQ